MLSLCRGSPSQSTHFFAHADDSDTDSDTLSICSPTHKSSSFESTVSLRKPKMRPLPPLKRLKQGSEERSSKHVCAICLDPLGLKSHFSKTHASPPLISTIGELLISASVSKTSLSLNLVPPDERLARLPCGHTFHALELQSWALTRFPEPIGCPTCREPLLLGTLPPWVLNTEAARGLPALVRWTLWWQGAFIGYREDEMGEDALKEMGFQLRQETPRGSTNLDLEFLRWTYDPGSDSENEGVVDIDTRIREHLVSPYEIETFQDGEETFRRQNESEDDVCLPENVAVGSRTLAHFRELSFTLDLEPEEGERLMRALLAKRENVRRVDLEAEETDFEGII